MSKYLKAFQAIKTEAGDKYHLIGECLIVEEIGQVEVKTASGIVLSSGGTRKVDGLDMNKPLFVRVLAVGEGFYDDETGESLPLETQVGDIILIGRMSVQFFSTFGPLISEGTNQIGLTRESEIRMRFKGEEGWDKVCGILEGHKVNNVSN
jgi:co-chaperonin GroES (HSP10)